MKERYKARFVGGMDYGKLFLYHFKTTPRIKKLCSRVVPQQVGSSNTGLSWMYGSVSRQENRIWLVSLHGWWQNRWRNGSDWKLLHDRKDLTPNICAVYTEKDYRRKGVAGHLLNMVVSDLKFNGIPPVYLVTDHTGLYKRYGWEFLCMVQGDGEPDMSRMYIHR